MDTLGMHNENRKGLESFIQNIPGGIIMYEWDGKVLKTIHKSAEYEKMFGQIANSHTVDGSEPEYDRIHPEDRENVKSAIKNALKTSNKLKLVIRIRRGDSDEYIWTKVNATSQPQEDGTLLIYVVFSDITEQMEAQIQLKKSEASLKAALIASKQFCFEYDPKLKTMTGMASHAELFGIDENLDDFPNCLIANKCICPDDAAIVMETFKLIDDGAQEASCKAHVKYQGKYEWFFFHFQKVFDRIKGYNTVIVNFADISEQKNAEEEYERRLASAIKMNDNAICSYQLNISKQTFWNVKFPKFNKPSFLSGHLLMDAYYGNLERVIDSTEKARFEELFLPESLLEKFNNGFTRVELEHHYKFSDGFNHWIRSVVEMTGNPVTGDVEGLCYTEDIHQNKVVDMMLNGIAYREFDIVAMVYQNTRNYVIIDQNGRKADTEYKNFDQAINNRVAKIIIDNGEKKSVIQRIRWDWICSTLEREKDYIVQFSMTYGDGIIHRKKMRFSYLDEQSKLILFSCRDITDLFLEEKTREKELADALEKANKANKAKSEFLSQVSHDIRTPLNGMIGMIQLAEDENPQGDLKHYLDQAHRSADFLHILINDILDMSKIEAGKLELHPEPYSVKEFFADIDAMIRPLCEQKNIKFTMDATYPDAGAFGDKLRVKQIFFNLLSNSVKYTMPGGKVQLLIREVHPGKLDNCVEYIVKDNGIGMSEEFQKHLFETFSQEHRKQTSNLEGTGLGLSIVYNLVQMMGGTITVKSEIDKGTEFHIVFKLSVIEQFGETEVNTKPNIESYNFTGLRLLLCEDNKVNQEIAVRLLRKVGFEIDVADNGEIGLNKFLSSQPGYYAAILMDERMPVMNGLDATKKIRASVHPQAKDIPIIAMTANALDEDRKESREAGMNDHITKPINREILYKTIGKVVFSGK